jgi:hypothetical protein
MERTNKDLAVLVLEVLIDRGLVPVESELEYSDLEWEIQDTILEVLNKYLPSNNK